MYEIQLTRDAVSTARGLRWGFYLVALVYAVLTGLTWWVLRRLAADHDAPAPQEAEATPAAAEPVP